MTEAIVYHHLGLGDHFIHHGAIRKLLKIKNYDKIYILTKNIYLNLIKTMFKDDVRIDIIECNTNENAISSVNSFDGDKYNCWWYNNGNTFVEDYAYEALEFSPDDRYKYFYIERDLDREKEVFDVIAPKEDYIFIADDSKRNFRISDEKALRGRHLKIARSSNYLYLTPFDLLKVIENSVESHCLYSSFNVLIDCMNKFDFNFSKLFLHESYINKVGIRDINNSQSLKSFFERRQITFI